MIDDKELRTRAYEILSRQERHLDKELISDKEKLIEEVKLQQIELEIQKQELLSAKNKRHEIEEIFSDIFKSSAVGNARVSPDGTLLEVNKRFAEIIGYHPEELKGSNFREITCKEDLHLDEKYIEEVVSGVRDSFELEKRYIHKDGHLVWIRLYSNIVRDSFGNSRYAVASITDISKEKEYREESEEYREKMKLLLNASRYGMWQWDLKTQETIFDENALNMLGYSKQFQRPAKWWIEQIHAEDQYRFKANLEDYLSGSSEDYEIEFRMRKQDGEYLWLRSHALIMKYDEQGKPVLFVGTHQDITQQKLKEERFSEYKYMMDSIIEPISIVDNNFVYIKVNNAYQRYYNIAREEIEGHSVEEMMGSELFNSEVKPHLERCMRGEVVHYQRWFDVGRSEPFYHDVKYFPYFNKEGEVTRIIVSSRDLTSAKIAEAKADLSSNLLDQIFNVSVPLCLINKDYEIERVNDSYCMFFGFNKEDITGKRCSDVWQGQVCKSDNCMLKMVLAGETGASYLTERKNSKGEKLNCIVDSHAIYDNDGEVYGVIENFIDVTELKDIEQQLQLQNAEIESQNEELTAQNKQMRNIQKEQSFMIRQLQETEKLLNQSRERYQLLSEVSFEGIIIHKNGLLLDTNQRAVKMLGYENDELLGRSIYDLVVPGDRAQVANGINKEKIEPYRVSLIQKNGEELLVEIEARNVQHHGESIRMVAIRDLTERVKVEEALSLSRNKFHFYIDNAPNGFFAIDKMGRYQEVNKAFCEITGYSEKELLKMSLPDILHPGSIKAGLEQRQKLLYNDHAESEMEFIRKDGEERIWYETGRKLTDGTYIAFTQDITEQKKALIDLSEREEMLKFAIEQMPAPVIMASAPDGRISYYNQDVVNLFYVDETEGKDVERKPGGDVYPIVNADGTPFNVKELPLSQTIKKGRTITNQQFIVKHPDRDYWISANAAPLYNDKGDIIAGIAVFLDITELKTIEETLRKSELQLNEMGNLAKVGGWEFDIKTGKATWTKGVYDIVEIEYDGEIPDITEQYSYYLAEYRETVKANIDALIEDGTPLQFDAEIITEKGNILWVRAMGMREMMNGECVRIYGTFQDITQQKEMEDDIREKKAQLSSLLSNASDHILLCDKEGRALYFNYTYAQVMKDATGLDVLAGEILHKQLKDSAQIEFWEEMHRRVLNGEVFKAEYELEYLDGSQHFLEVSYCPVVKDGEINGFSEITREITARKLEEKRLKESEEKYRVLAETYNSIVLTHDLNGKINYINPYGAEYFKQSAVAITGSDISEYLVDLNKREKAAGLWKDFEKGVVKSYRDVIEIEYTEGMITYLEISATPIINNNAVQGVLIVAQDITDKKTAEKELAKHRNHLEELVSERTRELEEQNKKIIRINKLFTNREIRLKELKDRNNKILKILKDHGIKIDIDYNEI